MSVIKIGDIFDKLTVVSLIGKDNNYNKIWNCRCDCGEYRNVISRYLNRKDIIKQCKNCLRGKFFNHYKRLYSKLKSGAKDRRIEFNLSFDEFQVLVKKNCYYDNRSPRKRNYKFANKYVEITANGIDRIDSNKGYILDNCVPCCYDCNIAKSDMTVNEFKTWLIGIYNHYIKKK